MWWSAPRKRQHTRVCKSGLQYSVTVRNLSTEWLPSLVAPACLRVVRQGTPPILTWRGRAYHHLEMPVDCRVEYSEKGVLHLSSFFDSEDTESLRSMWGTLNAHIQQREGLERESRFVFGVLPPPIGDLYRHPRLVELVRSLIGPDVALYMNRLLLKDRAWNAAVEIHQDMPYFNGGLEKVSIFLPLQPIQATGGNGGLKYVIGSHKYGNLQRGTIERVQFPPMEDFAPSVNVGDIVVMNFLTWHYSEAAVIADDRPLLQMVYQPASDGSYGSTKLGVTGPTLVAGTWRTTYHAEWNRGILT